MVMMATRLWPRRVGHVRAFNQLVIDTTITGTVPVCSPSEFDELLGRADELLFEVEVESVAGTTPTLTLDVYHCNSGKKFVIAPSGTIITAASIASVPYRDLAKYSSSTLGSLVQLVVTLGGTTPVARVRVWACGRTK